MVTLYEALGGPSAVGAAPTMVSKHMARPRKIMMKLYFMVVVEVVVLTLVSAFGQVDDVRQVVKSVR